MCKIDSDIGAVLIHGHPNECVYCHKTIIPKYLYGHNIDRVLEVIIICPNQECSKSFIGYYYLNYNDDLQIYRYEGRTSVGNLIGKKFSETIQSISESFVKIYNQAYAAEQQNLLEICGVGYRKALEFLIKDYIISIIPNEQEKVVKEPLSYCITKFVDDVNIQDVAKRAAWLGNDETHYFRKWEGKNLDDLKTLINLVVYWIESKHLTKKFITEMPDKT